MEYLPENQNSDVYIHTLKKETKLKEFRKYLVEKNVVLAYVKFLLSLRTADPKPPNPSEFLQDYFGEYRDTEKWDEVDKLKEENEFLKDENPKLQEKIEELELELAHERFLVKINEIWNFYEKDKNGNVAFKIVYKILTGNPKFEVATAVDKPSFQKFMYSLISDVEPLVEDASELQKSQNQEMIDNKLEEYVSLLEEATKSSVPIFDKDFENPKLKFIAQKMKEFDPSK